MSVQLQYKCGFLQNEMLKPKPLCKLRQNAISCIQFRKGAQHRLAFSVRHITQHTPSQYRTIRCPRT
eukprot:1356810-Rhodomonas_salina.2